MPVLTSPAYQPKFIFKNNHFSTMYSSLVRKVNGVHYHRERLTTPDQDFIDLDWASTGQKRLLLALHGLEGSSESMYIKGLVRAFHQHNWDAVAMNFRSCSGEPNLQRRCYHSGETTDLDYILNHILQNSDYEEIVIVGFSLGGNVALKYGGEKGDQIDKKVRKIVGVSVPMDLKACSYEIQKRKNFLYLSRFLISLKRKYKIKQHLYPDLDPQKVLKAKHFADFDEAFTAPVHGFTSAEDYWAKSSSLFFLDTIAVPSLIINARDDSFLSVSSFPFDLAEQNHHLHLLASQFGGHVGFPQTHPHGFYWTEEQILRFVID